MNLKTIIDGCNFSEKYDNNLKKVYGIVKKVEGSNAVVALQDSSNLTVTLPNKTSEPLRKNDNVWIYYWNKISQGYIALKNDDDGLSAKITDLICNHMEIGKVKILENDCNTSAPYIYKKVEMKHTFSNPVIFTQVSYEERSTPLNQKLSVHTQEISGNTFYLCIGSNTHNAMENLDTKIFTVNYLAIDLDYKPI